MGADAFTLAREIAEGDCEMTPEAVRWLREGMRRFLAGDDLAVSLRLTGSCRKRARNEALLRAAAILDDGRGLPPWGLSHQLAAAQARFESAVWPRCKADEAAELSALNSALRDAFATGAKPLRDPRRLYDLLATDKPVLICQ